MARGQVDVVRDHAELGAAVIRSELQLVRRLIVDLDEDLRLLALVGGTAAALCGQVRRGEAGFDHIEHVAAGCGNVDAEVDPAGRAGDTTDVLAVGGRTPGVAPGPRV